MPALLTPRRSVGLGFGLAGLILVVIALLSFRSIEALRSDAAWVTHTQAVIEDLQRVNGLVKDAQRGERGYLLTGQERFLQPYDRAVRALPSALDSLFRRTADNPDQQQRLREIDVLLAELLAGFQEAVNLRREEGLDPAIALVAGGEVKEQMDRLGRLIDRAVAAERELLAARTAATNGSAERTELFILLGGLLALLFVAVAGAVLARDVLRRQQAETALAASETRFRTLVENGRSAVVLADVQGRIMEFNREAERLHGAPREEVVGRLYHELFVPPERRTAFLDARDRTLHGHPVMGLETVLDGEDGERVVVWNLIGLTHEGEVETILATGQDITPRKRMERQLRHASLHDQLTGLPNRALLFERLRTVIERQRKVEVPPYALLYFDLDRFKLVNDSFGHTAGDALLVETGRRLRELAGERDLVVRLGGDEFAVLSEDATTPEAATALAERIRAALRRPVEIEGREVVAPASIGIVLGGADYERPEDVLRDADLAMYQAKQHEREEAVFFEPEFHERNLRRFDLLSDLRRAIDREEFVLHYQPIVALADGSLAGFEALVRWQHPERGLVPPMDFIPLAEETGLITPLGDWVLRTATRQAAAWKGDFPDDLLLFLSVNFSRRQLREPHVAEHVAEVLREAGLDPSRLVLEITETLVADDDFFTRNELPRIEEMGVRLCVDDFGKGYSSLSFLQDRKVSALKIDRSFTSRLDRPAGLAIARTIVELARHLGLHVVAEGIETPEQLAALRDLGCAYGQGYHFSRPVDPAAAGAMLAGDLPWGKTG